MSIPQVVIVGRPNVGKSSIFNWLAGKRLAIVDDVAGVTRDRNSHLIQAGDRYFELVDTGGVGVNDVDDLSCEIEEQIAAALDSADVILLVVDSRTGPTPLDEEAARRLRFVQRPVLCAANKTDDPALDPLADEFYGLGCGDLVRVSAQQNRGKEDLLAMILQRLPEVEADEEAPTEPEMKAAIVGRRNVGKSTFVNALAKTDRMIVSETPGTTRDSVDVRFELDGKAFIAIDTPGLRRRRSARSDVDFYGIRRAQRSVRRADVVLLFFDASERISKVDKQLCKYIADNCKPCIFVVNKWDLMVGQMPTEQWGAYLGKTFPMMRHAPIAFVTAQTGKNVKKLVNLAQMLFKQARRRIPTGPLNRLIGRALEGHPPPIYRGRRPKIFYATQVDVLPPTMVLICSNPKAFSPSYLRYLHGVLRDELDFGDVPLKLYLRERSRDGGGRAEAESVEPAGS